MLKIGKATYKNKRLVLKEEKERPEEGSDVVVIFEAHGERKGKKYHSLYGSWRDKFPEDLDLNKEIQNIRTDWKKRLKI